MLATNVMERSEFTEKANVTKLPFQKTIAFSYVALNTKIKKTVAGVEMAAQTQQVLNVNLLFVFDFLSETQVTFTQKCSKQSDRKKMLRPIDLRIATRRLR